MFMIHTSTQMAAMTRASCSPKASICRSEAGAV